MWRRWLVAVALTALAATPLGAAEPPSLTKARELYNQRDYDAAIEAAAEARRVTDWADTAAVVQGRAFLERYRQRQDPKDLMSGRDALWSASPRAVKLAPRDYVDLLVGLGQYMYLAETFGPASEVFDTALSQSFLLSPQERLRLLDWWAHAMNQSAQTRPAERRAMIFERLMQRMDDEIHRDPSSPVANYWLAVAARGIGDIERAWDAATAAWVRSSLAPETSAQVREDLDLFVTKMLVPDRVRLRGGREPQEIARVMLEEWEQVKQQWK